jgi:tRNA(Ile)-lysidine synthase
MLALVAHCIDPRNITAVHVHHGLSVNADDWQTHCARVASDLGCQFISYCVDVVPEGEGLEAAARQSRYQVFEEVLQSGGTLLMGHHADDQLETQLLNMLRGSGPAGMVGIPAKRQCGNGQIVRPLLGLRRADLNEFVRYLNLPWIEDESNASEKFDRNFLRINVLPLIQQRFPQWSSASRGLSNAMSDADALLVEIAGQDVDLSQSSVDVAVLKHLSPERQRNALIHWFYSTTGYRLSRNGLQELIKNFLVGETDATPEYLQNNWRVCLQRGKLWLLPQNHDDNANWQSDWDLSQTLHTPYGDLTCEMVFGGWQLPSPVTVCFRQGGEKMTPIGRGCNKSLKTLFKELNIPEWQRSQLPLIKSGGEILSLADKVYAESCRPDQDRMGCRVVWSPISLAN